MTQRLRVASFHSLKGGVGKSTLAAATAWTWASERPSVPVYLVDLDLVGAGLVDGLALEAPWWEGAVDITRRPDGRHVARTPGLFDGCVPRTAFVNDLLLHMPKDWSAPLDASVDASVEHVSWRPAYGPSNLRVLPAATDPIAMQRITPVLDDEHRSGFLESRLEWLLESALEGGAEDVRVVIDNSAGMHGYTRAALGLCVRLGSTPKRALSSDGAMPHRLQQAEVTARGFLVTTSDARSSRATERLARLRLLNEPVTVLTNRADGRGVHEAAVLDMTILESIFDAGQCPAPVPGAVRALGL